MSDLPSPNGDFRSTVTHLHGAYRAQHVHHTPPDERVDDAVTWAILRPHVLRAGFFVLAPVAGALVLGLVLAVLAGIAGANRSSDAVESIGVAAIVVLVTCTVLTLLGAAALFFPLKEPIAEYAQVVEGRGWASSAAFYWIERTAYEHRVDFGRHGRRVGAQPVMLFRHGRLQALLTVRTYGDHLSLGWTMWRTRSTVVLLGHFLRDSVAYLSPTVVTRAEMRAADTRAMREIVHSLTREGVQAAIMARAMVTDTGQDPQAIEDWVASLQEAGSPSVDPFRS